IKRVPIARKNGVEKRFARRRRFAASFGALGVLILVLSLTFGRQTVETKRLVPKTTALADTTKQVVEEPQFAIAESPSNDRIAAPQLVDGTELSSESEIVEEDVASSEVSDIPKNVEIQTTASENQFVLRRQKINEVAIGSRTDGANPQGNDGSDESIFREVEHLIYSFELVRDDGSVSKVKLLRSVDWLDLGTTRLRDRNSGKELSELELIADRLISPELQEAALDEMALDVLLDLPEVGCVGWAELVDADDSFEYREGVGNLVTGTFEHVANELLELTIEGDSKPITCTPNHPFWSVDREDFVEAGELLEGERLLVFNGETKRVVQKLPRPGPETVYNLEVFSEHVYRVAMDGVLVHNPYQIHHFATNKSKHYEPIFTGIVSKYKHPNGKILTLKDDWNKKLLPHNGRHTNYYHEFVYACLKKADKKANGNTAEFLRLFDEYVKQPAIADPSILYSKIPIPFPFDK
ncbi:MAG: AHH domain-containing protein, partial [Thermoguttaceae bacterium]|nr:AHH domain-containing protein [Thermoguttaceae bacterium]